MKIISIVSIIILLLFFAKNLFSVAAVDNYTVIRKIDNIEIRQYKSSIYASYTPKNEKERNNSFKKVASFIFGNNTSNEKISMTSPVVIKMHNNYEMAFLMPRKYNLENLNSHSGRLDGRVMSFQTDQAQKGAGCSLP